MLPLEITDPQKILAKRYFDEDFYKLEVERLWPHVWQMACRLEQIPNVGDWVEYSNVGNSIIIVRTPSGVKAFHNACRHRGVPLVTEGGSGNCAAAGFICPFHGWRWNTDGENTFVYCRHLFDEALLDKADLALRSCRVETWGGCAFINLDDDAPSLRDTFGPVTDNLDAHGMSDLRSEWWFATVLPANWKIAMEAFMEGYHVMRTHPQLHHASPVIYQQRYGQDAGAGVGVSLGVDLKHSVQENIAAQLEHMRLLSDGMAGMLHAKELLIAESLAGVDLPEDPGLAMPMWFGIVQDQISRQLRARGEKAPDLNTVCQTHPVNAVEFLFPHYFLLPIFTSMASYRIRPLGPESCLFEIWALTHMAPGEEAPVPMAPTVLAFDSKEFPPIPQQDYSNIPLQQKGLHSAGFEFMRLSKDIEGLISNYQRIIDGHLQGVDPAKLTEATRRLCGNFDGKIFEFDF